MWNVVKKIKYYINGNFRKKVVPVPGSVLYCDLHGAVEHSGIYGDNHKIIELVLDSYPVSVVKKSTREEFTDSSSEAGIYVSSNNKGAVGNNRVGLGAKRHIGEENRYSLLFNNCHDFAIKCLSYSTYERDFFEKIGLGMIIPSLGEIDIELSIISLKRDARDKIGATKWYLWKKEGEEDDDNEKNIEPDIDEDLDRFEDMILNEENIMKVITQLEEINRYIEEISDEDIPEKQKEKIILIRKNLNEKILNYEKVKMLGGLLGNSISSRELNQLDMSELFKISEELKNNEEIKSLIEKIGREYISDEIEHIETGKNKINLKLSEEVFGLRKSNDLSRILPNEIIKLTSEELEYLFYSKYLEHSLWNVNTFSNNFLSAY